MSGDESAEITSTDIRLKPEVERQLLKSQFVERRASPAYAKGRAFSASTGVGTVVGPNLVIGEFGADWAMGIAAARRNGPNLALLTQWAGETSAHFAGRVSARLAKRESFESVVVVCNDDHSEQAVASRRNFVAACARLLPKGSQCVMIVLCQLVEGKQLPGWANGLRQLALGSQLILKLEASGIAA